MVVQIYINKVTFSLNAYRFPFSLLFYTLYETTFTVNVVPY